MALSIKKEIIERVCRGYKFRIKREYDSDC